MVSHPALRKVIGTYTLGTVAAANQALAGFRLFPSLRLLLFVKQFRLQQ